MFTVHWPGRRSSSLQVNHVCKLRSGFPSLRLPVSDSPSEFPGPSETNTRWRWRRGRARSSLPSLYPLRSTTGPPLRDFPRGRPLQESPPLFQPTSRTASSLGIGRVRFCSTRTPGQGAQGINIHSPPSISRRPASQWISSVLFCI